jgi:hypothetical protein
MPLILPGNVASATAAGYDVDNSCRFNDDDSAYMHITPGGAGNRRTFTLSWWFKTRPSSGDGLCFFFTPGSGDHAFKVAFDSSQRLYIYDYSDAFEILLKTNRKFRDVSAWYHVVIAIDTTQATDTNRAKMYVNGVQESSFETATYPDQNYDCEWSGTNAHNVGKDNTGGYFDGYLAEVVYIDGSQEAVTSFGEFDSASPTIWKPIDVSGLTFGTNGFYLDFEASDNLGNDANGGTDLTEVNLAAADQMVDTPTNNFPTASPIFEWYYTANIAMAALSEGNLKSNPTSNQVQFCKVPFDMTGKVYFEVMPITQGYQVMGFGETLCCGESSSTIGIAGNYADGINIYVNAGTEYLSICVNGSYSNDGGDNVSISAEDIVQFAYDADTGKAWLGVNNTWHDSGDPANGTNPICTFPASTRDNMHPCGSGYGAGDAFVWNFGQNSSFAGVKTAQGNQDGNDIGDFYYAPPSGFLALCSKNRSDTTINDPEAYFQTKLYTGNGTTQSITLDGDTDMQPDLVWAKQREDDEHHALSDSVRGATKQIYSSSNVAEQTQANALTSFDSDGFSVDDSIYWSDDTEPYVAWCWKESATAGFDIVSYTGNGTDDTDISHNLSAVPKMIIVKNRDADDDWQVYHAGMASDAETDYIVLNEAATAVDAADRWSDEAPTSSVFTLGDADEVNTDTEAYIAYAFAPKQGFSKFGSWLGNGSTDGPFIYTGFKPAFILYKRIPDGTEGWILQDNKTSPFNVMHVWMSPHSDQVEAESANANLDFLSNGFKLRHDDTRGNTSGITYIYAAFAEAPFVNSNGVPCNAR